MAFGDEIQAPIGASGYSTAPAKTFGSSTTSGNLLICWVLTGDSTLTEASGWSVGVKPDNTTDGDVCAVFYKVSDGTETDVTCSSGSSDEWAIEIAEYEGPINATPVDLSYANARDATPPSSYTMDVNGGTTSIADEILVAVLYSRNVATNYTSWTNSFVEKTDRPASYKRLGGALRVVSSTGVYSTNATLATAQATTIGGMVTFQTTAGGGATGKSNPLWGPLGGCLVGPIG